MAIKILATKTFTDTNVNDEATIRTTNDSDIMLNLSDRTTAINDLNVSITSLATDIVNETSTRTSIIGSGADFSGLVQSDMVTPVTTMSQAIKALYLKNADTRSNAQTSGSSYAAGLLTQTNNLASRNTNVHNGITTIINNASASFDTFVELFNLTQGNRTNVLAAIDALKTSLLVTSNSKTNKVQTDTNTIVYLDQSNLTTTYKLVIDNGALQIVEV